MDYQPFLHPSILAAEDPAPELLGSEEDDCDLYAELWQQILQLTSDEEDKPAGSMNQRPCPVAAAPSPVSCSHWQVNNGSMEPLPVWWLSPQRSCSGTGVFIPTVAATGKGGRRGKSARKKKAKKQVENQAKKQVETSERAAAATAIRSCK